MTAASKKAPRETAAPTCPFHETGLQLRSACEDCQGRPEAGQLRLAKREYLYHEGDQATSVYLLVEGYLRETRTTEDGRIQGIRLVRPGELAGTEALVRDGYQCAVDAVTPSRVCRVPLRTAAATAQRDPKQGWLIAEALARELVGLRDHVVVVGALTAEERVLTVIRSVVDSQPADAAGSVRLPLTRQDIADLLGLTQATVSRVFQRLAREGVISVRGAWVRLL